MKMPAKYFYYIVAFWLILFYFIPRAKSRNTVRSITSLITIMMKAAENVWDGAMKLILPKSVII